MGQLLALTGEGCSGGCEAPEGPGGGGSELHWGCGEDMGSPFGHWAIERPWGALLGTPHEWWLCAGSSGAQDPSPED